MKKTKHKKLFKVLGLFLTLSLLVNINYVYGAKKVSLNNNKVTLQRGEKKTVMLKNVKKKVKWRVKNKKIVSAKVNKKKYNNKVTIKGLKVGKTTVVATYKNKKYKVTIKVVKKENPTTNVVVEPEGTTRRNIEETTTQKTEETTTQGAITTSEEPTSAVSKRRFEVKKIDEHTFRLKFTNDTNESLYTSYKTFVVDNNGSRPVDAFSGRLIDYNDSVVLGKKINDSLVDKKISEDYNDQKIEVLPHSFFEYTVGINSKYDTDVKIKMDGNLEPGEYFMLKEISIDGITGFTSCGFTIDSAENITTEIKEPTTDVENPISSEEEHAGEPSKRRIEVEKTDEHTFDLKFINDSDETYYFGYQTFVQKYDGERWVDAFNGSDVLSEWGMYKPESGVTSEECAEILLNVLPHSSLSHKVGINSEYGTEVSYKMNGDLEPGRYRMLKQVYLDGMWGFISGEFTI